MAYEVSFNLKNIVLMHIFNTYAFHLAEFI